MRLNVDPMLILEYFLWRKRSEYAISSHYDRHCVWEEVLQNKRLNKYSHTAIDEQFQFYQSDGLIKFNESDENAPLPSYVPEGSFIVRAHTPMSNLFSCLWFNEVNRFTSRDQLSFAYTFLKLRRMNPGKPFFLNMFKLLDGWFPLCRCSLRPYASRIAGASSYSILLLDGWFPLCRCSLRPYASRIAGASSYSILDCERRAMAKLFHHRAEDVHPPPAFK